jgi:hypothetical protein
VASVAYHDLFWYPRYAAERITPVLQSDWGRLFANWNTARRSDDGAGFTELGQASPELVRSGLSHFAEGLRLVGMAVAESPEVAARKRRESRPAP